MLSKNSIPRIEAVITTAIPMIPINIPRITARPSFFRMPSEMIRMPTPGIKLDRGIGSNIRTAKAKEKPPIILSPSGVKQKSSRGSKNLSALPV